MDKIEIIEKNFVKIIAACNAVGSVGIFILMLVVVRDVGLRTFFNIGVVGTAEIVANSLVAIFFLQIAYVLFKDRHIKATVLYDKYSTKVKIVVDIATFLLGILVFALVIYASWSLFVTSLTIGEWVGDGRFRFPVAPVRGMILFGSLLMCITYLFLIINRIRKLGRLKSSETGGEDSIEGGTA